ncbi:hypothetical protein BaRGS_00008208 [Batillaria attramentaria]|uniref:Uncharacterized protein n=1 Tax=Batillaria attramentaria TaxID=370345 RepID=A0ABD0LMD9_9CAEN
MSSAIYTCGSAIALCWKSSAVSRNVLTTEPSHFHGNISSAWASGEESQIPPMNTERSSGPTMVTTLATRELQGSSAVTMKSGSIFQRGKKLLKS